MTIPPLAMLLICAAGAFTLASIIPILTVGVPAWVIILCVALGTGILLPAIASFLKHKTTVNPVTPSSATALVTKGIFGITRNPMYVGMLLLLLGFVLWLGAVSGLIMVIVFFILIDRNQIPAEERSLQDSFGDAYRDYAARVPRWMFIRERATK